MRHQVVSAVHEDQARRFVLHAEALHGNPYDGPRSVPSSPISNSSLVLRVRRIHGGKGYRGHNYPDRFMVWSSGHARRVTQVVRREMRRRAAAESL
jgi:transposase, IS5 family